MEFAGCKGVGRRWWGDGASGDGPGGGKGRRWSLERGRAARSGRCVEDASTRSGPRRRRGCVEGLCDRSVGGVLCGWGGSRLVLHVSVFEQIPDPSAVFVQVILLCRPEGRESRASMGSRSLVVVVRFRAIVGGTFLHEVRGPVKVGPAKADVSDSDCLVHKATVQCKVGGEKRALMVGRPLAPHKRVVIGKMSCVRVGVPQMPRGPVKRRRGMVVRGLVKVVGRRIASAIAVGP